MEQTQIIRNAVYSMDGKTLLKVNGTPEEVVVEPGTVRIASNALNNCQTIKRLVIPSSVKFLKQYCCDNCTFLSEVIIETDSKMKIIEDGAFYKCSSLRVISLPTHLRAIGHHAFYGCDLDNLHIPASVDKIGSYAFASNNRLKRAVFDENSEITYSNRGWFCSCDLSEGVVLPRCIKGLSGNMFSDSHLDYINIPDSVVSIDMYAFCSCLDLTTVNIGKYSRLESIRPYAFIGCKSLKCINLPFGLEEIGDYAFTATGLTSTQIPNTVKRLGIKCFKSCYELTSLIFGEDSQLEEVCEDCLSNCPSLKTISCDQETLKLFGLDVIRNTESGETCQEKASFEEYDNFSCLAESEIDELEKDLFGNETESNAA